MNTTSLGEILTGDRTYFPEPVAYDNQRRPIIPAQLGARPIPMAAGMGQFYEEGTITDAVKPAAVLFGIPLIGWAVVVTAVFGVGMLMGAAENRTKGRRRR